MAGANKNDIVKFLKEEINETETALSFVTAELGKPTTTQFNRVYTRKKHEYEGALWAFKAVLDLAEGKEVEDASANSE